MIIVKEYLKSERPKEIVRVTIRGGTQKRPKGTMVINRISTMRDNVKVSLGLMEVKRMILEFEKGNKKSKL